MKAAQPPSVTIWQIEFELGMGLPDDAERVMQLRNMLREARKRRNENCPEVEFSACRV